jgi:hypothetical protein
MKRQRLLTSSARVACPFCGKVSSICIDEGGGEQQTYVEDCEVCCRPCVIHFDASPESGPEPVVWVERGDGL